MSVKLFSASAAALSLGILFAPQAEAQRENDNFLKPRDIEHMSTLPKTCLPQWLNSCVYSHKISILSKYLEDAVTSDDLTSDKKTEYAVIISRLQCLEKLGVEVITFYNEEPVRQQLYNTLTNRLQKSSLEGGPASCPK